MACETLPITYFDSDIHTSIAYVVNWLRSQIDQLERDAEEYIQDVDNPDAADECLIKRGAFQEVINFLQND